MCAADVSPRTPVHPLMSTKSQPLPYQHFCMHTSCTREQNALAICIFSFRSHSFFSSHSHPHTTGAGGAAERAHVARSDVGGWYNILSASPQPTVHARAPYGFGGRARGGNLAAPDPQRDGALQGLETRPRLSPGNVGARRHARTRLASCVASHPVPVPPVRSGDLFILSPTSFFPTKTAFWTNALPPRVFTSGHL